MSMISWELLLKKLEQADEETKKALLEIYEAEIAEYREEDKGQ